MFACCSASRFLSTTDAQGLSAAGIRLSFLSRYICPVPKTNFIFYSADGSYLPPDLRFSQPRPRHSNQNDELWVASHLMTCNLIDLMEMENSKMHVLNATSIIFMSKSGSSCRYFDKNRPEKLDARSFLVTY